MGCNMRFKIVPAKDLGGARATACSSDDTIELSSALLKKWKRQPVRYWKHLLRTILHEVAHLQTPGHGHDKAWRVRAIALGASGRGDQGPMRIKKIRWMIRQADYPYEMVPCGCTNRIRGIDSYHPSYTCKFKSQTHYARRRRGR